MGYSIGEALKKEPAAVSGGILAVLNAVVLLGVITLSGEQVAGINVAIVGALNVFYIRPVTVSKAALEELVAPDPPEPPQSW